MLKYKTVYPIFEHIIIRLIVLINHRQEFNNVSKSEIVFLEKIQDQLEFLLEKIAQKPAISNVNIESLVNDCYRKDPSIHTVNVIISFVEEPDFSKTGRININLSK